MASNSKGGGGAGPLTVGYTVHSIVAEKVPAEVELADGQTVQADLPGFTVELVSDQPQQSNITLRFVGGDVAAAQALFEQDARIVGRFEEE